jgi:biopolymer transport protein TolR
MAAKLLTGSSARNASRRSRSGFNDINMTPFIDVMLVLLIVFMISAPMMTSGVAVDLPQAKSSSLPGNDEPLTITVRADGSVYIQESQTKTEELGVKLQSILGEKKETRIFVRGDRAIDYGLVMKVIGEVNAAGFSKVALLTDNTAAPARRR